MMSRAYPLPRRLSLKRKALMLSCASAAIAVAALAPRPAHAQAAPLGAFRGSITSQVGSVTRNQTSNTTETITIGSNTATINWSPTDTATGGGPIDFLPTGNVATYTSSPGVTFYTVLNRIVPTDPSRSILLDGSVISTLEGTSTIGGNVWFYSPGGIIIGANAMFDVGGLLLTTADLPNGFTADGNGFSASFSAPSDSLSAVQIMPGAEINALQQNSYVAVVAPRVEQGGTVKVDGSAAYAAATSLTMTMNQGLFDIQVDLGGGSDDTQGVVHTGSTTGGDTASQSDNHKVYMVAVPKNNAMTMLLGGTAGFDANVAGYENGQIVLSSGYNMNDLSGDLQRGYLSDVDLPGGIQIDPGTYLSDVVAISNGSIDVGGGAGNIDFRGNVSLSSFDAWDGGTVTVEASNGNTINVGGNLAMHSENPLFQDGTQVKLAVDPGSSILVGGNLDMSAQFYPGYGGTAQIDAFGGTISIGGLTTVNVDGIDNPAIPYGDQRRGGSINISSTDFLDDQGSITTGGMVLSANAVGHDNSGVEDSQLVDARGGTINVNTGQGGALTVNGNLSAAASAFAGQQSTSGFVGGEARGGEVHVGSSGGTLHITGNATLNADATGGDGATGIDGGAGFGGIVDLYSAGDGNLQVGGGVLTSANGTGGNGQNGGFGQGGHSGVGSTGGSVTIGGNAFVSSQGFGGNASFGFGGTGGSAQGGVAFIEADSSEGGFTGSITGTTATITSDSTGGTGGAGDGASIAAGAGGSAAGGLYEGFDTGGAYALADINGATLSLTSVTVSSSATGGAGGTGGAGQSGGIGGSAIGGTAQAGTWNPTATTDLSGSAGFADIFVAATGRGGNGGAGGAGDGNGGTGTGGGAVFAADGDTSASYVNLNANGTGGNGANGGTGYGGSGSAGGVLLQAAQNANMVITGGVDMSAIGQGGFASTGTGGSGYGGDAAIQIMTGGSITGGPDGSGGTLPTGDIWVFNKGQGGDGGTGATGGNGGDGYGGNTWLLADGLLHTGETVFRTLGVGGTGGTGTDGFGGNGGYGQGGTSIVNIGAAGAFDSFEFTGFANGVGGDVGTGTSGSGNGGSAHGGTNTVTIDGEASAIGCLSCGPEGVPLGFVVTAYGFAANGQNGGDAVGGNSSITVNGSLSSGSIVQASGQAGGGNGAVNGGNAQGGSASITTNGSLNANSIFVGTTATGGNGTSGNGGHAAGGSSQFVSNSGATNVDSILVRSTAFGGNGGVNGAYADGGSATLTVRGTLNAGDVSVDSSATGGNGTNGLGGESDGGSAHLIVDGGTVNAETGLSVRAVANENSEDDEIGNGGNGATGGGESYGGSATIQITSNGGDLHVGGDTDITARALGGAATGNGSGAAGYGGYAGIIVDVPGSEATTVVGLSEVFLNGNGLGGVGGNSATGGAGGNGYGGSTELSIGGGTFGSGNITAVVRGRGATGGTGSAGLGGNGGYGEGGSTTFWAAGASTVNSTSYTASSNGAGGAGGSGSSGFGDGGVGEGGYGEAVVDSLSANFTDQLLVTSFGNGGNGANGGDAYGGTSTITINGTVTTPYVQSTGQSQGGIGSSGIGGDASSGNASLTVNGTLNGTDLLVATNATGGVGVTGGGSAYGGDSSFFIYGTAQLGGSASVQANAIGGNSSTGTGGYGEAGWVDVEAWDGGIASFADLTASADGVGGNGTDGGFGEGGSTFVSAQVDGHINVSGQATASATGTGGSGSSSGTGGDGFGGDAEISGVGGHTTVANALIRTTGAGGAGGTGGNGIGGSSIAGSRIGGLTITNQLVENADGLGGAGLNGDGGYGDGGLAFINANLSGDTAATATTIHNAILTANGVGGSTSTPGATGGSGAGGFIQIYGTTNLGTLSIDSLQGTANGTGGTGATTGFGSGGSISLSAENDSASASAGSVHVGNAVLTANGAGAEAGGGIIDLFSEGGNLTVDSATLTANGPASGGGIFLFSEAGSGGQTGFLHFGSLNATANGGGDGFGGQILAWADGGTTMELGNAVLGGGFIELLAGLETSANITASQLTLNGSDIFLASYAGGDINVSGELLANAFNTLSFFSDGNGGTVNANTLEGHGAFINSNMPLSAQSILFDGGTISLGDVNATGLLSLIADGDLSFGDAHAGHFDFEADGSVVGGDIVATGRVSGEADGDVELGNITAGATDSEDGDFSVGIAAEDSIDVGNVTGAGSVGFATLGDLNTGNINAGNVFLAMVGQDTNLGSVTTPAGGRVYIGNASMFLAAGGPDDFNPAAVLSAGPVATGGSITFGGPVSTGKVQAAAGTGVNVGNMTAASSVDLRAGGLANFTGTVSSPTITVTSGDINIADGASLGVKGVTNLITLNATNDEIVIGGDGEGDDGEYYLSEDGDISSNSLVFNAVGTGEGAPDITVLDTEIEGSQTSGRGVSHVTVNTNGTIFVQGHVDFINAGATDSLALNAGERIEVVTDTGSIAMTNSSDQLSGSLSLKAHDIWVASQAVLDQLEANPDFDGRDAALATNSGPVNPGGYIQAGGITVTMLGSSFMVQNSGTGDEFAGLSVGNGGLTIINQGNDPATVILFGRQVGSDGSVVGNEEFADDIVVSGPGGTTSDSTANGCSLGGVCGQTEEPEIPPEVASSDSAVGPLVTQESTTQSEDPDDSDDEQEEGDAESDSTDASVHLINTGPLQNTEIIDDPITSGNDGPGGPQ